MSEIIGDTACPKCRENGKDKTGNHLILFDNGAAFCNRCGYREKPNTFTKPTVTITGEKSKEEIERDIRWVMENSVELGIKDRGLKAFACKFYGVRTGLSKVDGVTPVCYYLPISDGEGVQGFKVKSPDKEMWAKGNGKDAHFFGAHVVPRTGRKLFVTEGQEDCVALYQTIYEFIDPKYRSKIAVVSLQNGAGSADTEFARNAELVRGYKEVVLCFDMDKAGDDAVAKVLTVLSRDKVRVAKYPMKDANDMVKAGEAKDLYFRVLEASAPRPEKILCGVSLKDMMTPLLPGIETPYPVLNSMMRGFRYGDGGGELTVVCAGPGMGKTTFAKECMYKFNAEDKLVLSHIYLEEQVRKTGQSYIALDNNVPLPALRMDPTIISNEAWLDSSERLVNNGRCYFFNHWGSIDSSELMDHMYYFSKVCGSNFIMLDHISLVVSGNNASSEGERKDIDILMTKLATFCENSGTSVIAIVHLNRPPNGSFNEGSQISLRHLRGSTAIEGLAHNIIAIEGNQQGDKPNERYVRILKCREWGDVGLADTLDYVKETGRLVVPEQQLGLRG